MLNSKTIGNKIVEARKKINLSQSELAKQVSISPQAVGKWERGESMPDITTLHRLAEIFGVDLNYFSEKFHSVDTKSGPVDSLKNQTIDLPTSKQNKNFGWNWNMSQGNWVDADFSGLKNIQEKFSASNIKKCKFIGSDLSGLILKSNDIENCDFSSSDMRNSKIQSSEIAKSLFMDCSLIDTEFAQSEINNCNFNNANFSGAEFTTSNFQKNALEKAVWKHTSFKNSGITDIVFEGTIEDCSFENCSFKGVKFQHATIINTFFKNNSKLNRVQFIDCKVDTLTYAFLKNNQADLTGITIIT